MLVSAPRSSPFVVRVPGSFRKLLSRTFDRMREFAMSRKQPLCAWTNPEFREQREKKDNAIDDVSEG